MQPLYNEEEGENPFEDEIPNANASQCYIPEGIHEHVDSVYLNFNVEDEMGILCFVYETSYNTYYVWTSAEALEFYNQHYSVLFDTPFEEAI